MIAAFFFNLSHHFPLTLFRGSIFLPIYLIICLIIAIINELIMNRK